MMKATIVLAALLAVVGVSKAQGTYWVVEGNQFVKNNSVVKIYDAHNVLIHAEVFSRSIDISKKRDRKFLDKQVQKATETATAVQKTRRRRV